jgi:hypothetical protein
MSETILTLEMALSATISGSFHSASVCGLRRSGHHQTGDALPGSTPLLIRFLSYARTHFGRDQGTARTGLKWVVSAAGHKYLASVAGGNLKAVDQPDEPSLERIDGRSETLP